VTTLSLQDLRSRVGQEVATSEWLPVTQERINLFADATGDHQWIHVDTDRARTETAFGTTIAHGFLTLSLVSTLMRSALAINGLRMTINYGLNRVRFVSPVPAGAQVRARVGLLAIDDTAESVQATWTVTVEGEGQDKPCVVAEWIVRYYPFTDGEGARDGHEGREGRKG
jgi:acyl dehydratase